MSAEHSILIVEDDGDTRRAMKIVLETQGYSVILAVNGADGLAQLRAGLRPCLILLDMMMPEKNGFQFRVEQILDPVLSQIPVIVYSGDSMAQSDLARLGGVAHFSKPVDVAKLLAVIRDMC